MKKIIMLLNAVLISMIVSVTVLAAQGKAIVPDVSAERTKKVYLSVELKDCGKANTLGISMDYDSAVLKKVASECTWEKEGILQDFDVSKNNGVWASKKAVDVNGKICTLVFQVKTDAPIGDSEVTCKVVVKNDSKEVGTYVAKGIVTVTGEHTYGEWKKENEAVHKRVCETCGYEVTEKHVWREGEVTKEATEKEEGVLIYQCDVCDAQKQEVIKKNDTDDKNTSNSSGKQEDKTDAEKNPSRGGVVEWFKSLITRDSQKEGKKTTSNKNEDNIEKQEQDSVISDAEEKSEIIDNKENHVHVDNKEKQSKSANIAILLIVAALVSGIVLWIFKKNNKK